MITQRNSGKGWLFTALLSAFIELKSAWNTFKAYAFNEKLSGNNTILELRRQSQGTEGRADCATVSYGGFAYISDVSTTNHY